MPAKGVAEYLRSPKNEWLNHPLMTDVKARAEDYLVKLQRQETSARTLSGVQAKPVSFPGGRKGAFEYQQAEAARAAAAQTAAEEAAGKRAAGVLTEAEQQAKDIRGAVRRQTGAIPKKEAANIQPLIQRTQQEAAEVSRMFERALEQPTLKVEYDALRNLADLTLQAETQARLTGVPSTVYNVPNFINQAKAFLRQAREQGSIPQSVLLSEGRRLDHIAKLVNQKERSRELKQELTILGGQLATGRLPSALRTGVGIVGRSIGAP